jgi:3-carboxy-cis,cis-muconate cycloisomerase
MAAYVIDSRLFGDQFSTEASRRIFSDENTVQKWLDVEAALARVEARLGVIPQAAADEISRKAKVELFNLDEMKREMDRTSHPIVPLVRAIKKLCDGDAGEFVHWGATTQDIMDTGTILQLREALDEIEAATRRLLSILADLAETHKSTVMAGRTHGQQALPITFGFKVAQWLDELCRNLERFQEMQRRVLVGQFGGAVGTLAALGAEGEQVHRGLMNELGLACPQISWQSSRDRIAELVCVLAICTSTIGRMAHEIYCLQKTEFAELEEPFSPGKVGSSTMPHKRNPPTCETIVAISKILRSTAPLALEAMMTEHERDKIGLQTEREFISRACCLADAAAKKAVAVAAGLTVKPQNMERNLWLQKGLLMSEPVMMALGAKFGRQRAHEMVYEICMKVFEADASFKEGLLDNPDIKRILTPEKIDEMLDPHIYTGSAGFFVDRIVGHAREEGERNLRSSPAPVSDKRE